MGGASSTLSTTSFPVDPVTLHIYDAGSAGSLRTLNKVLRRLGTGIYHCGVEVYGREWSFGAEGVFCTPPGGSVGYPHFESIPMGKTSMSNEQVLHFMMLSKKEDWTGADYNLLEHNCCHFCDELCRWLGVGGIPEWTISLAGQGADLSRRLDWTSSGEEATAGLFKALCCSRGIGSSSSGLGAGRPKVYAISFDTTPEEEAVAAEEEAAALHDLALRKQRTSASGSSTDSSNESLNSNRGIASAASRANDAASGANNKRSWTL